MAKQLETLELDRCPHCSISLPNLQRHSQWATTQNTGRGRQWATYGCRACGGAVLVESVQGQGSEVTEIYPKAESIDDAIPERAREFLKQAANSIAAPAGAVMLAASAVDAMLKEKGYEKGTLNERIDNAVSEHLITEEMGNWGHEVRMDANDQRHADTAATLPTEADARRIMGFATALADFLFVLPSRVARGRQTPAQ